MSPPSLYSDNYVKMVKTLNDHYVCLYELPLTSLLTAL